MTLNDAIYDDVIALYCGIAHTATSVSSLGQVYVYDVTMYDDVNFQARGRE